MARNLFTDHKLDERDVESVFEVNRTLAECKASASDIKRIQVRDIVKEVEDYLKTYSSDRMDISWYVDGRWGCLRRVRGGNTLMILLPFEEEQAELSFSE
ncbi:hypothetical protein Tco_1278637 [Tanacetum coccineum]